MNRARGVAMTDKPAAESGLIVLCDAADVADDTPVQAEHDGAMYAVFAHDGSYYVTQDLCTHGPGNLSEGFVEGCEVECPFHQGKFNFITGAPASAPCTEALRTWEVTVADGKICIDPNQA
jgi:nitrite reductase/ring-hydroxylating ferredoxin subunit